MHSFQDVRTTTNESLGRTISAEHGSVRERTEQVERLLEAMASPERGKGDPARGLEALRLVTEYERQLLAHFRFEESSGVIENAVAAAPRLSRKAEALLREHGDLREQMRSVAIAAEGAAWSEAHGTFVALRHALGAHERGEEEILRSAYLDDLGGTG